MAYGRRKSFKRKSRSKRKSYSKKRRGSRGAGSLRKRIGYRM